MDILAQGKTGVHHVAQQDRNYDGYDVCHCFAGDDATPEVSCCSPPLAGVD